MPEIHSRENLKSKDEKLAELKKMVIGFWIHRTMSWDEWREYHKNDEDWIGREGLNTLLREETLEGAKRTRRSIKGLLDIGMVEEQ